MDDLPDSYDAWKMDPQDGSEQEAAHETFQNTADFDQALTNYADEFEYSAEYEIAFDNWHTEHQHGN